MHIDTHQVRHMLERQTTPGLSVTLPGSRQDAHAPCLALPDFEALYTDITLYSSQAVGKAQGEEGMGYPSPPLLLPLRPACGRVAPP